MRAELTEPLDVKRPGIRAGEMQRDTSRAFASPGGVAPFAGAVRRSSFLVLLRWVELSETHRMNRRRRGAGVLAMGLRHEHRRQSANREIPAFDH
jgi:hypothetical protein